MLLKATPDVPADQRRQALQQAARVLAEGRLLGLPTETVYGLAARADDDSAVAAIFAAKQRPASHPLIVHVPDLASAAAFVTPGFLEQAPAHAARLMQAFWPGPLTVIVPRRAGMAQAAAGGQDSVGLRCPSHPLAQAVLQAAAALGVQGVAAPSANTFGRVSPTTAAHVQQEFGDSLTVLDGGACQVGIESTIIDCTRGQPVLLRPGIITPEMVEERTGIRVLLPHEAATRQAAPRASGTLTAHYAPQARVCLMTTEALQQRALDGNLPSDVAIWSRTTLPGVARQVVMPDDAAATAQQLFARLRDFDAQGMREIWVEAVPASPDWAGVADRLQRAAAA